MVGWGVEVSGVWGGEWSVGMWWDVEVSGVWWCGGVWG